MTTTSQRPATALTTGKVRGSYLHLWSPHKSDADANDPEKKATYNGNFSFPKSERGLRSTSVTSRPASVKPCAPSSIRSSPCERA